MGRFVLWLVALVLDPRANGCQQVHHHLARFSILEIHAWSIHAHWVDATHDEHAVVYHDVVAESHAADGARGRACPQLSFLEKHCVRYRSNGVGEDGRARALEQFRAPLGNVSQFRQRATRQATKRRKHVRHVLGARTPRVDARVDRPRRHERHG